MRKTKIIATIGPATKEYDQLKQLADAGVNIFRLNFSHGSSEWFSYVLSNIKKVNEHRLVPVATLLDLQGPVIRIEVPKNLHLKKNDLLTIWGSKDVSQEKNISEKSGTIGCPECIQSVQIGDSIALDSGLIQGKVVEKNTNMIVCKILNSGILANRKHINFPGVPVILPTLTKKDLADIEFGIQNDVDFFAMSFVRKASDIQALKTILKNKKSPAHVIAKIEDSQGIEHMKDIIQISDGIMVARGDMGIETPLEEVPLRQKEIITLCLQKNTPVIVATNMLESMTLSPVPTRAEVTDVSHAVAQQTDAIMLSGETTVGKFPIECVKMMDRIATRREREQTLPLASPSPSQSIREAITTAACSLAENIQAAAIIVFTRGGTTVTQITKSRSSLPIYACTNNSKVLRQMNLLHGVTPFLLNFSEDPEETIQEALRFFQKQKMLKKQQNIVLISSVIAGKKKNHDAIQVRVVE